MDVATFAVLLEQGLLTVSTLCAVGRQHAVSEVEVPDFTCRRAAFFLHLQPHGLQPHAYREESAVRRQL